MEEERLHEWDETGHPKKRAFLAAYVQCGSITATCEAVGIGRETFYRWKREDEVFQALVDRAEQMAADELEHVARERAKAGSDTLLIFLLKGLKPEKYGDSIRIRKAVEGMTDEQLRDIIRSGKTLTEADSAS